MKKIFIGVVALLLVATPTVFLAACGSNNQQPTQQFPTQQFPTQQFIVTFNTKGGSTVTAQSVNSGSNATRPTPNPTRTGWGFVDWFTAPTGGTVFDFSLQITANTTIYAQWYDQTTTFDRFAVYVNTSFFQLPQVLGSTTVFNRTRTFTNTSIYQMSLEIAISIRLWRRTTIHAFGAYYRFGHTYTLALPPLQYVDLNLNLPLSNFTREINNSFNLGGWSGITIDIVNFNADIRVLNVWTS